jgi:hypothetical protein
VAEATVLWAGRPLTGEQEAEIRRLVALLERVDRPGDAAGLARFLPENDARWTPDELERGAHLGPWLAVGASAARDGGSG